ncbi:hypothetical protein I5535_10405 [Rhodobacteraceae bacterium F11138]|nr:hypothetical protein [Rhodobacteraceae bacterium F11138]
MSFEVPGAGALDDVPCRYGTSRLLVRGPERSLDEPYVAFLGSSDTYGKFIDRPFPALAEDKLGVPCINLGCVNAGVDAILQDDEIMRIAGAAECAVVQAPEAQNLSNRFYRVHPRRNDRFLEATPLLAAIYDEVDFTDFHFNKHMLFTLYTLSPRRFEAVRLELQDAWVARMRLMLRQLGGRAVVLWLRHDDESGPLGPDPLMVTAEMLAQLKSDSLNVLEIPVSAAGQTGEMSQMRFGSLEAPAAELAIGPGSHRSIAVDVATVLGPLI